jgi:hypothetical protein
VRVVPAQVATAFRYTRRPSDDHWARSVPVQSFASTGCSTPLASMCFVAITFPSAIVVTSTASAFEVGVMQTSGAPLGIGTSGAVAVQHPRYPCQREPLLDCATPAAADSDRSAAAMATERVAAARRSILILIFPILV